MPADSGFVDFVIEQLAPLGQVRHKRMFGGGGLWIDGIMFALIGDGQMFMKADAANRGMFEAEGMGPFVYEGKGKPITMSYWRVPEHLYDEPDELLRFAGQSLAAAHRAAAITRQRTGKRASKSRSAP